MTKKATTINKMGKAETTSERIVSIDALRGFTMIFIIGGGEFIHSFYKVWPIRLRRF